MSKIKNSCSGIYAIYFKQNPGKKYIGSAVNIEKRWSNHKSNLLTKKHKNRYLLNAVNKYGFENLIFEVLEVVDDPQVLVKREQQIIDEYGVENLYNLRPIARSNLGVKYTDEAKQKMSAWQIGRKLSPETIAKFVLSNQGQKHRCAKLNDIDVMFIKGLLLTRMRLVDIAFAYGVHSNTISSIKAGRSWGFIEHPHPSWSKVELNL